MLPELLMQVGGNPPRGLGLGLGINLVSIGLLLALLVLFGGMWRKTKAPFALGLMIFAGVMLLEDLTRVLTAFRVIARPGVELLPDVLELAALVVLLYLATR